MKHKKIVFASLAAEAQQSFDNCGLAICCLPEDTGHITFDDLVQVWSALRDSRALSKNLLELLGSEPTLEHKELMADLALIPAVRQAEVKDLVDDLIIRCGGRGFLEHSSKDKGVA